MKSTEVNIREATVEDLSVLKAFEQGVIQFERPFAPNLKDDPIEYYDLKDLILREDAQVLVAVIDGELVGSGYALIKKSVSYKNPDEYAYLGFMYVSPEFRGKGINGKIIDSLTDWAKKKNLTEVQLDVYAENEVALNAYKKRKFKPDLLKMRLSLEE